MNTRVWAVKHLGCVVSVQGVAQVWPVSCANLHILQHHFICRSLAATFINTMVNKYYGHLQIAFIN